MRSEWNKKRKSLKNVIAFSEGVDGFPADFSFLSFLVHLTLAAGPHPTTTTCPIRSAVLPRTGYRPVRCCTARSSCLTWGSFGFLSGCGLALRCGAVTGRKKGIFSLLGLKKRRQKANHIGWGAVSFSSLIRKKMSWQQRVFFCSFLLTILSYSFLPNWKKEKEEKNLLAGTSLMGRRGVYTPLHGTDGQETADRFGPSLLSSSLVPKRKNKRQSGCWGLPQEISTQDVVPSTRLMSPITWWKQRSAPLSFISSVPSSWSVNHWTKCIGSRHVWSMASALNSTVYSTCSLLILSLLFYCNLGIVFYLSWKLNGLTILTERILTKFDSDPKKFTELIFDILKIIWGYTDIRYL